LGRVTSDAADNGTCHTADEPSWRAGDAQSQNEPCRPAAGDSGAHAAGLLVIGELCDDVVVRCADVHVTFTDIQLVSGPRAGAGTADEDDVVRSGDSALFL